MGFRLGRYFLDFCDVVSLKFLGNQNSKSQWKSLLVWELIEIFPKQIYQGFRKPEFKTTVEIIVGLGIDTIYFLSTQFF